MSGDPFVVDDHIRASSVTTTYRSIVVHIPPTQPALLPERWTVEHWCNLCRQRVKPEQLITHAQDHEHAEHDAHHATLDAQEPVKENHPRPPQGSNRVVP